MGAYMGKNGPIQINKQARANYIKNTMIDWRINEVGVCPVTTSFKYLNVS